MTVRLETAKQLLKYEEYEAAKQMLEKDLNDSAPESLYLLSLLCRYFDAYDQERGVVERALAKDSQNTYMQERLAWHNLPLFDRLVPRKPIEKGSYEYIAPIPEVIDNMCFVAGADSGYFTLLVECLESIRNTRTYKDVDICVLDCGLTDDEKHYLMTKLRVAQIKDPGWDVEVPAHLPQPTHSGQKSLMARCHLYKHFPQYKYIFFLDADIWVQDETGIHMFVDQCYKIGNGLIKNTGIEKVKNAFPSLRHALEKLSSYHEILDMPWIAAPLFLIDTTSEFCQVWSTYHDQYVKSTGQIYFGDEVSLLLTMKDFKINTPQDLVRGDIHISTSRVHCDNSEVLWSTQYGTISPFIHHDVQKHNHFFNVMNKDTGQYQVASLRYRTWPWQDKEQLKVLFGGN